MEGKFNKRFIVVVLLLLLTMTTNAFASSEETGDIDGNKTKGTVSISGTGATATTSIEKVPGNTLVSLTYTYVNEHTNTIHTIPAHNQGYNYVSASASKPSGPTRSYKAVAKHTVNFSAQTWTANTSIYY